MKITLTGSLGNVSKPLAEILISSGHDVTIISSDAAKKNIIDTLGAKAASPASGLGTRWAVTSGRHRVRTLRTQRPACSFASAVGCYCLCRFSLRLGMRFGGERIVAMIGCDPDSS
jgi:hypothetical protein